MSGTQPAAAGVIDVVEMTVEKAQAGFASGAFTSESLTKAFLDRIALYNPSDNAIVFMNPGALDAAKASDERRKSHKMLGPLDGVPVVVKDAMDMVGSPTTGGWRLLNSKTGGIDLLPATDAPVVARMREAGAVILGRPTFPSLARQAATPIITAGRARPITPPDESSCPAGRALERRPQWLRVLRCLDSQKRQADRSRTQPRRKASSASNRPSPSCRT
jgi:hypothetical protein